MSVGCQVDMKLSTLDVLEDIFVIKELVSPK